MGHPTPIPNSNQIHLKHRYLNKTKIPNDDLKFENVKNITED